MNGNSARRLIGAMLVVAMASGATFATSANAQPPANTPADTATAQMATRSATALRHRPDRAIIIDVRRAFRRAGLDDSRIRVRAHFGVVTLNGTVPERAQIARATRAARSVLGVTGVQNRLTTMR